MGSPFSFLENKLRRVITQIGQSIYEWFFSQQAQDNMVSVGKLAAAVLGTSTVVNGLAVTPTAPASLQINVAPGELYALAALEATICGTLPADTTHQVVKQGILLDKTVLGCAPPPTAGQSINYLIQAQYQDVDISLDPTSGATPVVLQFFNSSNPSQPYNGPNNSGATSNTFRSGSIALNAKAGIAATTGSQVTPAPDAGCVGLFVVTVANGQTTIVSGNITQYAGAPIISETLTQKISQTTADGRYAPISSSPVIGSVRNAKMSVTAANASATFTADEIVVESALGGTPYKLSSFSQVINLGTTGAGGMDTGSAPVSGFVAIYASCKAGGTAPGIFACNAATSSGSVYSGANLPAGVVATALIGIWPTTAASLFAIGYQIDREIFLMSTSALSTSTAQGSYTSLSLASIVPAAAKSVTGIAGSTTSNGSTTSASIGVASSSAGLAGASITGAGYCSLPFRIPLVTSQTLFYTVTVGGGTLAGNIGITSYTF